MKTLIFIITGILFYANQVFAQGQIGISESIKQNFQSHYPSQLLPTEDLNVKFDELRNHTNYSASEISIDNTIKIRDVWVFRNDDDYIFYYSFSKEDQLSYMDKEMLPCLLGSKYFKDMSLGDLQSLVREEGVEDIVCYVFLRDLYGKHEHFSAHYVIEDVNIKHEIMSLEDLLTSNNFSTNCEEIIEKIESDLFFLEPENEVEWEELKEIYINFDKIKR